MFGEWLRKQRNNRCMTLQEFADLLGVTLYTIHNCETGKHKPSNKLKKQIIKVLKVKPEYLNKLVEE